MPAIDTSVTAIILNKSHSGDSDVYLDLLTKELGRIGAVSRGVGHLKSRLRYALEPYSVIGGVIIKTKSGGWQLINAELQNNLYYELEGQRRKVLIRLFELIRRVVPPSEATALTDGVVDLLITNTEFALDRYLYVALYILFYLGYLDLVEIREFPEFSDVTDTPTIKSIVYNLPTKVSDSTMLGLKTLIQQAIINSQL